ncbi:hypothetical protein XELAEV_18004263mg [Xenopus laevis]|uniref:Uncharacterized protein n=1 Tax=Xenopus laevis TaxID=8355 RepID=A0A974H014_XENLA|nr:hypothetical protein XELAEV_18004263mg [Xenopus laevis]
MGGGGAVELVGHSEYKKSEAVESFLVSGTSGAVSDISVIFSQDNDIWGFLAQTMLQRQKSHIWGGWGVVIGQARISGNTTNATLIIRHLKPAKLLF